MSLRYALLALLTAQPMTGYDLAKAFHSSVGHVWHAPDGLLSGEDTQRGSRSKTRYSITDLGIEEFRAWMATPLAYALERDPMHLRAAYFEWTGAEQAGEQLRAHRDHFAALREQWQGQLDAILDHLGEPIKVKIARFALGLGGPVRHEHSRRT